MSDKLPTREEAKNHANMFRYYVSGSGKAAYDVLTSYADGLLQPTQTYSEEELLGMTPPSLEYDEEGEDNEFVDGYNTARKEIAHALAGKLAKPVVDREKLINLIEISDSFWEHRIEDLADLILAEVNGGD